MTFANLRAAARARLNAAPARLEVESPPDEAPEPLGPGEPSPEEPSPAGPSPAEPSAADRPAGVRLAVPRPRATLLAPGLRRTGLLRHEPAPPQRPDPSGSSVLLRDVSMVYPNGKRALVDVDLVVPDGDFVFIVGPSGAGKTTLIKLLLRDEVPTSGVVYVAGQDLTRMRRREVPRLRRRIGIVFQDYKLLSSKTVRENVAFALEVTGTPRDRVGPAVERALALVGLSGAAEQRPAQLSGGEQQRTAIARAMVHEPRVIIADEPTGNLDPLISWEIIQLLLRINEMGTTVLMATHNAEVVTALRRRVVALEEGRIVRDEVGGYHRAY